MGSSLSRSLNMCRYRYSPEGLFSVSQPYSAAMEFARSGHSYGARLGTKPILWAGAPVGDDQQEVVDRVGIAPIPDDQQQVVDVD